MATRFRLSTRALVLAAALCGLPPPAAFAAPTDLASEPLNNPAASTKPNLLFILDDSGSMGWDFSPDYISHENPDDEETFRVCFDNKDASTTNAIETTTGASTAANADLKECFMGDPPFAAPAINKQYYNPNIRYNPPVQWDDTAKAFVTYPVQDAAATANWTAVPTDPFGVQRRGQLDGYGSGNVRATVSLVSAYPDRLWCANFTDADAACRRNTGAYEYPSNNFGRGKTAASTGKGTLRYTFGAPYYYNLTASEYCTTPDLIVCNTQAAADATYPYPAPVRWCTNAGFSSCQGKRVGSFTYPKFAGTVASSAGTPAKAASGTLVFGNAGGSQTNVTAVTVGGTNIMATGVTVLSPAGGTDSSAERDTFAQSIRAAIVANAAASGYTACDGSQAACNRPDGSDAPTGTVVITATSTGPASNGFGIEATSDIFATASATASFIVTAVADPSSLTTLTANGNTLIGNVGVACNRPNNLTNRRLCAQAIVDRINANTAGTGYTASRSSATVTITAPLSFGASANGFVLAGSGSIATDLPESFSGGVSTPAAVWSSTPLTGGADAIAAFSPVRQNVGAFSRVDIVPLNPDLSTRSFPRANARTDCVSFLDRCTYTEEMTNFANWYSYYRTRMQMMKSATGRAFLPITAGYRVGFKTINFSTTRYLKIADFATDATTGGHKRAWFDKLYAAPPGGSTPLRDALSRAGWIFAGKLGSGLTPGIPAADDPMQYSCQPNFAILSSDGYWNSTGGSKLDVTGGGSLIAMGNEDGTNGGYSTRAYGAYEGPTASSNTLADVALHYYKNDLRADLDDLVKASQKEISSLPAGTAEPSHQRMLTFTMGLGLDGFLSYERDYDDLTKTTGDFFAIRQGTKNWPVPVAATTEDPGKLDDLWHAAVNGRGKFFSASNPQDIELGLNDALTALQAYTGAGAAAATSNLQPVAGDNFAFTAQYTSVDWIGDVKARTIDLDTGLVSTTVLWEASDKLDGKPWQTRSLYTFDAADAAGNRLKNFCWPGSLDASCSDGGGLDATEQAYFNNNQLGQYATWTFDQRTAGTGESLVNYLRGDRSKESSGGTSATDLYRDRVGILGDVVSAQPAYVRSTQFQFDEASNPGFTEYRNCIEGVGTTCPAAQFPTPTLPRRATLYIAANDGFLHAFETDVNNDPYYQTTGITTADVSDDQFTGNNTGNGEERWAFAPSMVLPKMHQLANNPYTHTYFVDGSPRVADICVTTPCAGTADWRTIVVGGLNAGGRGYYALDVTDPLAPKGLWEFKASSTCLSDADANPASIASASFADCHIGYSYGNPIVTKRNIDGRWVVIVASGYNNFNPGDGRGYLYVLDATTGAILNRLSTGVGSGGTAGAGFSDAQPSGLARINGWVANLLQDNTTLTVYGGDLQGNMWRFDLDSSGSNPNYLSVTRLFTAEDAAGSPQSITSTPELTIVRGYRVVFFGTGRYVGTTDMSTTQTQTIYAIRDDLTMPGAGGVPLVGGRSELVERTFVAGATADERTVASGPGGAAIVVDWDAKRGWYIDLPESGERVNVDPILQFGTLVIASNVPSIDACTAGGSAWLNFLDYRNGGAVSGYTYASLKNATSVIVGLNQILLPGGKLKIIATTAGNETKSMDAPVEDLLFEGKRVGWRELVVDR